MSLISETLTDANIEFNADKLRDLEAELYKDIYRTGYNDAVSIEMGDGSTVGIDSEIEAANLLASLNINASNVDYSSLAIIESYIDYGYRNGFEAGGIDS
jgi:hypothetical protein